MNNYEQMKNQFLVELNKSMSIDADNLNLIASALDVAASKYDIAIKTTSQPEDKNVIPAMLPRLPLQKPVPTMIPRFVI